jgi:hypothetical protein
MACQQINKHLLFLKSQNLFKGRKNFRVIQAYNRILIYVGLNGMLEIYKCPEKNFVVCSTAKLAITNRSMKTWTSVSQG